MFWTQTRSMLPTPRPQPVWPKTMLYDEFIAWNRGLLKHPAKAISRRCLAAAPGADASAIHGRLGARVALLQSRYLPNRPVVKLEPAFKVELVPASQLGRAAKK